MLTFPKIDPVALQIGPLAVHWYGLTYLAAFGLFMLLANARLKHQPYAALQGPGAWSRRDIEDMLFHGVVGVIAGGRLGYCLFYKPGYYATHPLEIFYVWQGGMSFHGGMLGVIVSQWVYARSRGKPFWQVMDFVAPCVPPGLAMGRVGNFINGELWGRAADPSLPWAMVFPQSGSSIPRHPSQVYQFLLEGLLLFILLWLYARKERKAGAGLGPVPRRLRRVPLHRRVLPRARLLPAMAAAADRPVHGAVAVRADDRRPASGCGCGRAAGRDCPRHDSRRALTNGI
jgi:phosphatidylglycerol:prolipoprotein diacylglycerol transferase